MSQCRKFSPNIFNKSKCSNCFRQKEEHSTEALESNRASRAVARSGYLFVAPDWDFSVPLNRTKRWQRRWFVLYDDGELNYSVDEHPETVPQGSVDMCKVMEVTGAEQVTGHPHSLALTSPDRVTFIKAASREDARWWAELLAVFPRRHKRNATFPGGRASPSLPQLGRSASPQPPRPRHLSVTGASPRANFITPPLKEEREAPVKAAAVGEPVRTSPIETTKSSFQNDYILNSGSPPTRDKLQCDVKVRARRDWRNERLRDIATALTDCSPESSLTLPAEGLLHLKKGWLWLKADHGEWSKRWWVICGPTLNAYTDQDEQNPPELTIELSNVSGFNEIATDTRYGLQVHCSGRTTLTLSAMTSGIRANWLQALKKAVSYAPELATTPRSVLLSSDDEYRTASEGGQKGSEDWSDLPPSPSFGRNALVRGKERARTRARLARNQSRQSTADSVSTDELDSAKDLGKVDLENALNRRYVDIDELTKRLWDAVREVTNLSSDMTSLKKMQSELQASVEHCKHNTDHRLRQVEEKKRLLERQVAELRSSISDKDKRSAALQNKCSALTAILKEKQDELDVAKENLAYAYKRLQEAELKKQAYTRMTTISDLTNVDLNVNLETLEPAELVSHCLDLRGRFEKAISEVRALKRVLADSHAKCDELELHNSNLASGLETSRAEAEADATLMASRLQDLTNKLVAAEKQVRSLKLKLQDSREKRRSLSLKGKESLSINKEVEDKLNELEGKILAIERSRARRKHKREHSNERSSPIDDRSLRRLRRKSLESTTSEHIKLLLRLSSLDNKVSSVANSNESLNTLTSASGSTLRQLDDPILERPGLEAAKEKVKECLYQVSFLKFSKACGGDKLAVLENTLVELGECLSVDEGGRAAGLDASARAVVKQLEALLHEKLAELNQRKQSLRESGKLDGTARLHILAEKVAYENVLVSRIQESLDTPAGVDVDTDRLVTETSHLLAQLQSKLDGTSPKRPPSSHSSIDHLTKTLANSLISSAHQFGYKGKIVQRRAPQLDRLKEKQLEINALVDQYRAAKLPQLAEALATEAFKLSSDTSLQLRSLDDATISETWSAVRGIVNSELVQSEINYVLMRAAQVYESNCTSDRNFSFSFFASERARLELWSEAVEHRLYLEMQRAIQELADHYQNGLNKLQRRNWMQQVESERTAPSSSMAGALLAEFADIVAHKALVDSRISVLEGNVDQAEMSGGVADEGEEWIGELLAGSSLEAEFKCMFECCVEDYRSTPLQIDLEQVVAALAEVAKEVGELQKCVAPSNYAPILLHGLYSWEEVCECCAELKRRLAGVRTVAANVNAANSKRRWEMGEETPPTRFSAKYQMQVESLRDTCRRILSLCEGHVQQSELEQLHAVCERVLAAVEREHLRGLQDLHDTHLHEVQAMREDKEQALAEETQATLAALDVMRKAHEAEVQREVAKFKQELGRRQQSELLELTERLSMKCLEATALEEQLGSASRELAHAQYHILQLERNPQLSMQN